MVLEVAMRLNVSARSPKRVARSSVSLRRWMLGVGAAVAMTAAFGACASSHNRKVSSGNQPIIVHITNDLAPPSDVTVYAVTQDGIRRLVGDVPPNKDKAMKVPTDLPSGSTFRLVAERNKLTRPIVSQPITATTSGLMVDWSLQTNAIWFPDTAS
jgi:hypothetical protein